MEDGKIIYASDFKDPDLPAPQFLILDIQHLEELTQLEKNEEIQKYFKENINEKEEVLRLIVHLSNPNLINT